MHRRLMAVGQRGIAVRALGGTRAGEMRLTRLLRNPKVSVEKIVEHARARAASRVAGRHSVAIQDTTSLRDDGSGHSIQAHPTIAVDGESGALLGLVRADMLVRECGPEARRKARAIEDKESRRWLDGAEAAAGLLAAGALGVTVVADRESDIYEAFARKPAGIELVIRAAHDRAVEESGEGGEAGAPKGASQLFARLAAAPEAGRMRVDVAAAPGRRARQAELSVRHCAVSLKRPKRPAASCGLPASVAVNVIELREIDPPAGATPVHWRLLTSHRVDGFAQARWIAGLYRLRWLIEELFRALKTRGFDIERVGIAQGPFEKLAAAALVAAIDVLALVRERDGAAKRPLADVFEPDERAAIEAVSARLEGKKQNNPHPKGSLAFAAWVRARLGGWTGYYGKPGPVVMLKGLHQFRAIQHGWSLARNV